jgi:HK97 family phage major capsid protein
MAFSEKLVEKRDALLANAQAITETAETEERDLTDEEDSTIKEALRSAADLDEQIKEHRDLEARAAQAKEVRMDKGIEQNIVVKNEARTYTERSGNSFLRDAYAAQFLNDFEARERLARHSQEERVERRDVTSSNFSGLIVPQYLTELAAPLARAGRPLADVAFKHALPAAGLTISISRVTTGSSVAEQTEGASVSETNMDDTKLDISIKTYAGQQNVSRQALERGTGVDGLVMADLVRAYHTTLDAAVVAEVYASAGTGITYTDASPTVAEFYPKLLNAIQSIQTSFYGNPNVIVMHPRRLAWILASVDSSNRPLAVPVANGAMNAIAVGNGSVQYGNSGYSIAGLPVITDGNMVTNLGSGTNEDVVFIGNTSELHLWEEGDGNPMMLRFEQPKGSELDVQMIVYGYAAVSAGRYPKAWAYISGTGLVTPTF